MSHMHYIVVEILQEFNLFYILKNVTIGWRVTAAGAQWLCLHVYPLFRLQALKYSSLPFWKMHLLLFWQSDEKIDTNLMSVHYLQSWSHDVVSLA